MRLQLQEYIEKRLRLFVQTNARSQNPEEKIERKQKSLQQRKAEIVRVKGKGNIVQVNEKEALETVLYQLHLQYIIKQQDHLYMEEEVENRKALLYKGVIVEDNEMNIFAPTAEMEEITEEETVNIETEQRAFTYNRLKAVQYAERWWNSYNPAYKKFEVDCTNFISQCLHAGGAPMRGYPNRNKGWWMQNNNWSYSWAVANSLPIYLENSTAGLKAKRVQSAYELKLGDVICYDFQGDGRFDHSTIVTSKDSNGEPLVNAHTTNSRMRYWAYEDSTAYTPNIQYKFFTIVDN